MNDYPANYHTHTYRCNHAVGEDRDYVENAIKAGMKVLGFSDHTPMIFPKATYGDYYSGFRMRPEEAEGYFRSVLDLRAEYKNEIEILAGVEVEYYPDCFPAYLEFMEQFPLDYMILAQHFVGGEVAGFDVFDPISDPGRLRLYYDTVIEAYRPAGSSISRIRTFSILSGSIRTMRRLPLISSKSCVRWTRCWR